MASSSQPLSHKENLAKWKNFSIDFVRENQTHKIQITDEKNQILLQSIPLDPTDHTVAGSISQFTLKAIGDDEAEDFLKLLSETLLTQLGAKELIVVPTETTLSNFTEPQDSGFARFRHGDPQQLSLRTAKVLEDINLVNDFKELTAELDNNFHFTTDADALFKGKNTRARLQEINGILEQARFTTDKMAEYKDEDLQGKLSRLKSDCILPIIMLDKTHKIAGMIRAVLMDNGFIYLSDEVMNQEILPLEKFAGQTLEEQKHNRELFLLAYLMNKTSQILANQNHLFIIAAAGREKIYEQVGLEEFPLNLPGWKAVMKFGPPGPMLIKAKDFLKAIPLPANNPSPQIALGLLANQKPAVKPAVKKEENYCGFEPGFLIGKRF